MADKVVTARRRAIAEARLRELIPQASETFGVEFRQSRTLAKRYPDLAAADLVENFADFIEQAIAKQKGKQSR